MSMGILRVPPLARPPIFRSVDSASVIILQLVLAATSFRIRWFTRQFFWLRQPLIVHETEDFPVNVVIWNAVLARLAASIPHPVNFKPIKILLSPGALYNAFVLMSDDPER